MKIHEVQSCLIREGKDNQNYRMQLFPIEFHYLMLMLWYCTAAITALLYQTGFTTWIIFSVLAQCWLLSLSDTIMLLCSYEHSYEITYIPQRSECERSHQILINNSFVTLNEHYTTKKQWNL